MPWTGYVYPMASRRNGTLYLGVTSNLIQRVHQHRTGQGGGFARKYGCRALVWYSPYEDIQDARARVANEEMETRLEDRSD